MRASLHEFGESFTLTLEPDDTAETALLARFALNIRKELDGQYLYFPMDLRPKQILAFKKKATSVNTIGLR